MGSETAGAPVVSGSSCPPRIEKIVVACDFDAVTWPALEIATRLSVRSNARLYLLHAVGLRPNERPESSREVDRALELFDRTSDMVRAELLALRGGTECEEPVTLECLRFGKAADEVVAFAEQVRASLVIAGSHARTRLGQIAAGSVSEAIWQRATCPVLVVHGSEAKVPGRHVETIERVLVAVDGSPASAAALACASSLCSPAGEIDAVQVLNEDEVPGANRLGILEKARDRLQAAIDRAPLTKGPRVRAVVQVGNPIDALVRRAGEARYDLVACGTHTRHGIARFLEKSVARALASAAPRLLVVRDGPAAARFGYELFD